MGRNAKTEFPRTEIIKVRSSAEHIALLGNIQKSLTEFQASEADVISWALEEFAQRNCKQIKFIPKTKPKIKAALSKTGREIIMGKNY